MPWHPISLASIRTYDTKVFFDVDETLVSSFCLFLRESYHQAKNCCMEIADGHAYFHIAIGRRALHHTFS